MTEHEAQELAQRLERVWRPEKVVLAARDEYLDLEWRGDLGGGSRLDIQSGRGEMRIDLHHEDASPGLGFETEFGIYTTVRLAQMQDADSEANGHLINQWMDVFRRGCWLSGCEIEASAHEKAEWMRGFTKEEIELWNLNV